MPLDATHDPARRSWVASANSATSDFPIQNLPFGMFRRRGDGGKTRVGVAIGTMVLDVVDAAERMPAEFAGSRAAIEACDSRTLNALMALGRQPVTLLREQLANVLDARNGVAAHELASAVVPMEDVELRMPCTIGDYTDFYASVHHATNVGRMFRPDNPLLPNYKYVPIGYHGRASSIVSSGTPVRRPVGQRKGPTDDVPTVGPTRALDYECEVGALVGRGSAMGETIPLDDAEQHVFGLVLVNDWSARDVQSWEYQPLGPFLAKNFATTISPWVVTLDALAPFRVPAAARADGDPAPLAYLSNAQTAAKGGLSITLEVRIQTAAMRARGDAPVAVSTTSFAHMYWTMAQLLTHHAMGGCNMRPGDLLASGTVSGPTEGELGCLLELTQRGAHLLQLPGGETRAFLEDGDLVELAGWCEAPGHRRIGFGSCTGIVMA